MLIFIVTKKENSNNNWITVAVSFASLDVFTLVVDLTGHEYHWLSKECRRRRHHVRLRVILVWSLRRRPPLAKTFRFGQREGNGIIQGQTNIFVTVEMIHRTPTVHNYIISFLILSLPILVICCHSFGNSVGVYHGKTSFTALFSAIPPSEGISVASYNQREDDDADQKQSRKPYTVNCQMCGETRMEERIYNLNETKSTVRLLCCSKLAYLWPDSTHRIQWEKSVKSGHKYVSFEGGCRHTVWQFPS